MAAGPETFDGGLTIKSGQLVEFIGEGVTKLGIVKSVRQGRATVIYDCGKMQVSGPEDMFHPSDKVFPKDNPSSMDKWGVTKYHEIKGHGDSPTFHAVITLDGKLVGEATNNGWGGPNEYRFSIGDGGPNRTLHENLVADAKAWVAQFGYADMTEPEDSWLDWYVSAKPFGVTAVEYIKPFIHDRQALESGKPI